MILRWNSSWQTRTIKCRKLSCPVTHPSTYPSAVRDVREADQSVPYSTYRPTYQI